MTFMGLNPQSLYDINFLDQALTLILKAIANIMGTILSLNHAVMKMAKDKTNRLLEFSKVTKSNNSPLRCEIQKMS